MSIHLFAHDRVGLKDRTTFVVAVCGDDVRKYETTDTLDDTSCRKCRKAIDDKMRAEAGEPPRQRRHHGCEHEIGNEDPDGCRCCRFMHGRKTRT